MVLAIIPGHPGERLNTAHSQCQDHGAFFDLYEKMYEITKQNYCILMVIIAITVERSDECRTL
jgi:hypothetical protein